MKLLYEPFSQVFESDQVQNKKLTDFISNADSIRGNLTTYSNSLKELSGNRDFNARFIDGLDINKEPDINELALQDVNEIMAQQNNMYIMGMITTTVLIVTCVLLIRK